jgi:hypothetical protein
LNVGYPTLVFQIPLNGFANAGIKGFCRLPAKFALYLAGVNGVAAVVAGSVGHVGD